MEKPKFDIPSLDGIRAVAFMLVFVGHAELGHLVPGGFGVTIFFFLSGFGGVLPSLNGWRRDPFSHRPDVIGQASRHRRGFLSPSSFDVAFA